MIIQLDNVHHSYESQPVLTGVDLSVGKPGISGLCAPNGEGKTTLLKLLAGLQFPTIGTVRVLGHDPRKRPLDLQQRVYFLPSEPFTPKWTPARIVDLYAGFYPNFDYHLYQENLEAFQVDNHKRLDRVSFGQKRRAQLSFALATRTQVMLFDEPTIGLDIKGKDQFRRSLIAGTEAGQTIVIATHLLSELENVLDHLILLNGGKIHGNLSVDVAARYYSFNLTPVKPPYGDKGYTRRVPGGYLTVHTDGRPSNTGLDFETLYLALTDSRLSLPQHRQTTTS